MNLCKSLLADRYQVLSYSNTSRDPNTTKSKDGVDLKQGNAERNNGARKTTNLRDFNALAVSTVCSTCGTVLKTYDSIYADGIIVERTELIEDRAARGCHLCAYFISRLSIDSEAVRVRATYKAKRTLATANTIDVSYRKFRHSGSSLSSSMMVVEITLKEADSTYGGRSHNLWTRFLPVRSKSFHLFPLSI